MWPGSEGLGPGSPCAFIDLAVGPRQLISLGFEHYWKRVGCPLHRKEACVFILQKAI